MKLSYDINRNDYVDFNKFHFVKTRLKRSMLTAAITIIALQVVLSRDGFHLTATIISSLVCILIYFLAHYISLSNTGKIPKDNGSILGHREVELNDQEIICKTSDTSSTSGWASVKELAIGKKALYLYVDTNMAILIPKRVFASEQALKDFEQFVLSKLKPA